MAYILKNIQPHEVRTGDLIFCARVSLMQLLCLLVGDAFRHVGIAAIVDGRMSIVEVSGGVGCQSRDLAAVQKRHSKVAIGRLDLTHAEKTIASEWAKAHIDTEIDYRHTAVPAAGMLSLARSALGPGQQRQLESSAAIALATQRRPLRPTSFTCSTFVVAAIQAALDDDRSAISPITAPKKFPNRGATSVDVATSRHFATPGDLWRSPLVVSRDALKGRISANVTSSSGPFVPIPVLEERYELRTRT